MSADTRLGESGVSGDKAEAAPAHVAQVRNLVFDVLDRSAQHALRDAARQIMAHLDNETC
jgi:hypothetical protein